MGAFFYEDIICHEFKDAYGIIVFDIILLNKEWKRILTWYCIHF